MQVRVVSKAVDSKDSGCVLALCSGVQVFGVWSGWEFDNSHLVDYDNCSTCCLVEHLKKKYSSLSHESSRLWGYICSWGKGVLSSTGNCANLHPLYGTLHTIPSLFMSLFSGTLFTKKRILEVTFFARLAVR